MTSREVTLGVWIVIGIGFAACCLVSALRPGAVATPRTAIAALVAAPWRRAVVVLGWMWLGWHLFAR